MCPSSADYVSPISGIPFPDYHRAAPVAVRIRVYERSGQLALATDAFDDDEAQVRSAVTVHQALVLNEKSSGLVRERRLVLELGIHPDRFDELMNQLRGIGHLESVSVQQRDRTGEFQRLHAQRRSLTKRHAAILKLRETKNLSIDDTLRQPHIRRKAAQITDRAFPSPC